MSSWSYRVVKKEGAFGIHEVYYDDEGRENMCTENPIDMYGESADDLEFMIREFKVAMKQPWLSYENF